MISEDGFSSNIESLGDSLDDFFYRNNYCHELTLIKNINIMGSLLYIIAVILVIAWLIGFVGYSAGGIIHILLVIAVIAVLLQVIQGRSAV